jgi:hypothetical protein
VSSNDAHFSTLQSRLLNIWHEFLDIHLGLAKSNSHLYTVLAYEPVALLESTEPTGALVIDTLPSNSVARRDFPSPTNTVAFRTYKQRELERRWADPRRGGKYRARGRIIRKEGYGRVGITPLCVYQRAYIGRFGLPSVL